MSQARSWIQDPALLCHTAPSSPRSSLGGRHAMLGQVLPTGHVLPQLVVVLLSLCHLKPFLPTTHSNGSPPGKVQITQVDTWNLFNSRVYEGHKCKVFAGLGWVFLCVPITLLYAWDKTPAAAWQRREQG